MFHQPFLKFILVSIGVALVVGSGFALQSGLEDLVRMPAEITLVHRPSTLPVPPAPVLEWKNYKNKKYSLEFSYPPEWAVILPTSEAAPFALRLLAADFWIYPVDTGRPSVFAYPTEPKELEDTIFHGKRAKLYACPDPNPCPLQLAYIKAIRLTDLPPGWEEYNDIGYEIYKGAEALHPIFESILRTFNFPEQTPSTSASAFLCRVGAVFDTPCHGAAN